ncbi:hypothetical protein EV426DRAFT_709312 [Tirmania nivea]|nr:hypothetical protein EV426DRAFT_709312 [Tirmania nivea]
MALELSRLNPRENFPKALFGPSIAAPTSTPPNMEEAAFHRSDPHESLVEEESSQFKFKRHTLGIILLFVVVVLWVSGNFLTWTLFSDETYSKPYLVSYVNSVIFSVYLLPWIWRGGIKELVRRWKDGERPWGALDRDKKGEYARIESEGDEDGSRSVANCGKLGLFATIRLSAEFAILWWLANYFSSVCYVYTSAASGSILSSTSSAWTFLLCAIFRVERFTWSKAAAVLVSLIGIAIISQNDSTKHQNDSALDIPLILIRKSAETLLGDFLALVGALFYGVYTTLLKVRVGDESRIDMQMLFGFSGVINALVLWPGVTIVHLAGWEPFELPSESKVWWMLAANYGMNLIADVSWAYAMLLTTPLLITVGLSLTIPVALLGQTLYLWEMPGALYWLGAVLVFGAFFFVNRESEAEEAGGRAEVENNHVVEGQAA